jgi:hypothetical protein
MLTVSFEMTPAMARELSAAADLLGMKNADVAREATRLLLRSVLPAKRGRPAGKRVRGGDFITTERHPTIRRRP